MLYFIVGLSCLVIGGFAGYYLGYDDCLESFYGDLGEEEQELIELHRR